MSPSLSSAGILSQEHFLHEIFTPRQGSEGRWLRFSKAENSGYWLRGFHPLKNPLSEYVLPVRIVRLCFQLQKAFGITL